MEVGEKPGVTGMYVRWSARARARAWRVGGGWKWGRGGAEVWWRWGGGEVDVR